MGDWWRARMSFAGFSFETAMRRTYGGREVSAGSNGVEKEREE